jgi:NADP-dependent 3-hydroxy acid dehydrogenase YdfG
MLEIDQEHDMSIRLTKISEQVVAFTGASYRIDLATAKTAAEAGAKLLLAARSSVLLGSTSLDL